MAVRLLSFVVHLYHSNRCGELESPRDQYVAELMRQNYFKVCASWRPAILNGGFPEADVDEWIAKARAEISKLEVNSYVGVSAGAPSGGALEADFSSFVVAGELGFEANGES